ncbi:hypothetical protein PPERSA_13095 [Pseudocohnilembus persalinus]|uniref:Uncharacterized protein n=1 Tax=Pseudocohnilembus persalinus TaxID=266149 RepID=A0A0V0QXJ4_PSEPJ|nr:hypothetical protein PPERSA_13095 [Pseudocohnilembus persalinus]|eukprot:KRX06616.1 hypothetical protein PPERSA_13095 [Pseudocohnilembus persalinus]
MECKKTDHYNQPFLMFKFTDQIDQMLQCISCISENQETSRNLIIDQIKKLPVYKIQNFPPIGDLEKEKKIRNILENCSQEKIQEFKDQIKEQINQYFQKASLEKLQFIRSKLGSITPNWDKKETSLDIYTVSYDPQNQKQYVQSQQSIKQQSSYALVTKYDQTSSKQNQEIQQNDYNQGLKTYSVKQQNQENIIYTNQQQQLDIQNKSVQEISLQERNFKSKIENDHDNSH